MVDSPHGTISSVVYTLGCNLRCAYCYNDSLVLPDLFGKDSRLYSMDEIKQQIQNKRSLNNNNSYFNKSDYIVISGGEPLLHYEDVMELATYSASLGFKVKVNTNATIDVTRMVDSCIVDYVSVDLKSPFGGYEKDGVAAGAVSANFSKLKAAKQKKAIDGFEIHTVLVRGLVDADKIAEMAKGLNALGIAEKWYLVGFKFSDTLLSKELTVDDRLLEPEARALYNVAIAHYDGPVVLSGY